LETGGFADVAIRDLARHCFVLGKPGAGKTHTLGLLADGFAAATGGAVVLIDLKGSDLREPAILISQGHSLTLEVFDPTSEATPGLSLTGDGPDVANLLSGTFGRGVDNAAFYGDIGRGALLEIGSALNLMRPGSEFPLQEIVDALSAAGMRELARKVPGEVGNRLEERANSLKDRAVQSGVTGLQSRLATLISGRYGRFWEADRRKLGWGDLLASPSVTYFRLPASGSVADTQVLGAYLLQGLLREVVARNARKEAGEPLRPSMIVWDEFPALGEPELATNLLLICRSAAISMVTASQLLPKDELLRGALTSAGVVVAHQVASSDAEEMSGLFGTTDAPSMTHQIDQAGPTGLGSVTPGEGYIVHPNILRRMPLGVALIGSDGGRKARTVLVGSLSSQLGRRAGLGTGWSWAGRVALGRGRARRVS
jgi:hypothetical protein